MQATQWSELTIVVEVCNENTFCSDYNLQKYEKYANDIAGQIYETCQNVVVVFNKVPKRWPKSKLYPNLLEDYDEENEYHDLYPRGGAFEVSTNVEMQNRNYQGIVQKKRIEVLFYSKIKGKMWPHIDNMATKIARFQEQYQDGVTNSDQLLKRFGFDPNNLVRQVVKPRSPISKARTAYGGFGVTNSMHGSVEEFIPIDNNPYDLNDVKIRSLEDQRKYQTADRRGKRYQSAYQRQEPDLLR